MAALLAIVVLVPPTTLPAGAETGERTLYLYHTHTHETARITFKRNGVYDPKGLQQLDWFLRDFRNNQPTEMAPQLFDLVWEVYQKSGATQPINIVSAYRSPATNADLHARSSGVANNSQHMLGHAMDWFVPGVPLPTLRAIAMQQNVGGVGFYPTSGSPFVHTDVGTVRAWPRMTEAQLRAIFPDGKTMHVPDNGRILSQQGYAYAQDQWNQCHAVPCSNPAALKGGAASLGFTTMVAAATTSMTGKTFADIHRGINPGLPNARNPGGINAALPQVALASDDETADDSVTAGPSQTAVATIAVAAPVPMNRPATLDATAPQPDGNATLMAAAALVPFDKLFPTAYDGKVQQPGTPPPLPAQKSHDMMVATGDVPQPRGSRPQDALGAIASIEAPVPAAAPLRPSFADSMVSAYAPLGAGSSAEHQLQAIIESETNGTIAPAHGTALTNSVRTPIGADALKSYAADRRNAPVTLASFNPTTSFTARNAELIAPGFVDALVVPAVFTSGSFAQFVEPSATDLNPATELGPMVAHTSFHADASDVLGAATLGTVDPMLVASR